MRKATVSNSRSKTKKSAAAKSVDEYLASVPEPARGTLQKVRTAIRAAAPAGATEVISYGVPAFKSPQGMVMWYAAFSDHCSVFPTAAVIEAFTDDLRDYRVSKGTLHFPVDKPLPAALIKKMVKARVAGFGSQKRR